MVTPSVIDATLPWYIAYQPVVRMNAGAPLVAAYESLLRIAANAGDHTTLSVITEAEHNGTMPRLDTLIASRVCSEVSLVEGMRIWLNLSQRTLSNTHAARKIADLIEHHNLACRITIEMTETADGSEPLILESLRWLKGRHITVVIDDIDDGHAKSHLLRSDLIAGCKLSRRATMRMASDPHGLDAISKLTSWCRSQGKSVVMEGIENEQELAIAIQLDVDYCQGFYFWAPVPLPQIPLPGTRFELPHSLQRHAG